MITLIRIAILLFMLISCEGYVRPPPKDGLQASITPAIAPYKKEWVDGQGTFFSDPVMTSYDIKIISYNILGTS
jgi:hypothetical protein